MGESRSVAAGRFMFELDGMGQKQYVKKFSGMMPKAQLTQENIGPSNLIKKKISQVEIDPATVELGMGSSKGINEWIQSYFDDAHVTKNGAIHACDFDGNIKATRQFTGAQLQEVGFPALDASSKEAAYMTVKFLPEHVEFMAGSGKAGGVMDTNQKKWYQNAFRITIGDLPCKRVTKCDALTFKVGSAKDYTGELKLPQLAPAKYEVPNVKLTISSADIEPWWNWYREFVINGACAEENELSGAITYLAADRKTELGTLELKNIGIIHLDDTAVEANKEEIKRFVVELYVEAFSMTGLADPK